MSDNPGAKQQKVNTPREAALTDADLDKVAGGETNLWVQLARALAIDQDQAQMPVQEGAEKVQR